MSTLKYIEKEILEKTLRMETGHVLNFTDRTFANASCRLTKQTF